MTGARRPRAVVTGASAGIGAAFAQRLARSGYDVIAVGRRAERLEELADRWRQYGVRVEPLACDLSRDDHLHSLERHITADDHLEVLVNNAGITHLVEFNQLDPTEIEEMIRVHVLALTRLTRAALPGMMDRGRGDIINVSSDGVFVTEPRPVMAVYAATKAYVNTFTQAIAALGRDAGVRAQAICPGYVRTEILERHGISFEEWGIPDSATMEPETLVDVSMAALELDEVICVPTLGDASILHEIEALNAIVRDCSSSSGTPASRYSKSG
jgi:uncharacterized protein